MVQELMVAGWWLADHTKNGGYDSFYTRQLYESCFTNLITKVAREHTFDEVSVLFTNAYFPFYYKLLSIFMEDLVCL